MAQTELNVTARETLGKGGAHALRREIVGDRQGAFF